MVKSSSILLHRKKTKIENEMKYSSFIFPYSAIPIALNYDEKLQIQAMITT